MAPLGMLTWATASLFVDLTSLVWGQDKAPYKDIQGGFFIHVKRMFLSYSPQFLVPFLSTDPVFLACHLFYFHEFCLLL